MFTNTKKLLILIAAVACACAAACAFLYLNTRALHPDYKKFIFSSEIPVTWSVTRFGLNGSESDDLGVGYGTHMFGQRVVGISPTFVNVGEKDQLQVDFWDIQSPTTTAEYIRVASLDSSNTISKRKIGDVEATMIIPKDIIKGNGIEYVVNYTDKDQKPRALLIVHAWDWDKVSETGFEHFLNKAVFNGGDLYSFDN